MGADAFPSHALCPFQQGVHIHQLGAIPMRLQNAPAAFDRIVFAVIGRVVQQVDGFADRVGEVHQAREELGPHPTAFRAIIDLELEVRDHGLLGRGEVVPPVLQAVDDEIAGLEGTAKGQMELPAVFIHQPERGVLFLSAHVVVGGPVVAPGFPAAGVVPDLHRGFAVDAQALDRPIRVGIPLREGLDIPFGQVGEDGIGFLNFFGGLALITVRRR